VTRSFAVTVLSVSLLASVAWSQCNNPTTPGVLICTPTNGSTVVYTPEISIRSTPAQGASITQFKIYDNNVDIFDGSPGQSGVDLYDGGVYNGPHKFVVNAWDSDGHLYQASTSVFITGLGYGPCSFPTSPGINFCVPQPSGAVLPTNAPVGASATGKSGLKNISFYVNGKLAQSINPIGTPKQFGVGASVQLPAQGVTYTIRATATDISGAKYSATKTITAEYTYGDYSCAPKGNQCYPGISVTAPQEEGYVGSTFNINAQILLAPKTITKMKAYLDNSVVATSSNSTLRQEVTTSLEGTQILTIQGWDDEGTEYRVQQNININVHP
jgi:hypothetical protein